VSETTIRGFFRLEATASWQRSRTRGPDGAGTLAAAGR